MREEFPLHDATFDGLVTHGKACTLYFIRSDGRGCEVQLTGVDAMQMDDFREGNIVGLFETTTGVPPSKTVDLERLYPAPHSSAAEEYHSKHTAFLDRKIRSIEACALTLVEMQPAVGADLLAVCECAQLKLHGGGS